MEVSMESCREAQIREAHLPGGVRRGFTEKKKKLFVNWKDQYEFAKQRREGVDFKQKKKHVQRRKKSKKGLSITIV